MPTPRTCLILACLLAPPACAQGVGDGEPFEGVLDWTVRAQPRVWLGAASGDLRLPGGGGEITLDSLDLDESALRPVLDLDLRRDRWRMTLTGFYLDEDSTVRAARAGSLGGVGFDAGDRLRSSFEYLSVEALGSYEVWRYDGGEGGWPDLESSVDIVGGARFSALSLDFEAERGSIGLGSSSATHLFASPVVGARWRLGLLEKLSLETELNVAGFTTGSDHSSFAFDVSTLFAYRPTANLGALFGYRQLLSSFEDGSGADEFEYTGATAGLFFGVELRF